MRLGTIVFIIVLLIGIVGWTLAYMKNDRYNKLQKRLLKEDYRNIGLIDDELYDLEKQKEFTLEELEESEKRIKKLKEQAIASEDKKVTFDEALEIVKNL